MNVADVPIPARMAHLPRDRRGYPVPVIVMRNDDGTPLFAANDGIVARQIIAEDRCEICGGKLLRGRWFVGGQLSAFAEHGHFMDAPMHDECAHYALRVCPYLAAPNYGRLVGRTTLARSDRKGALLLDDPTEANSRPPLFIAVMTVAQEVVRGQLLPGVEDTSFVKFLRPKPGSVRRVEVWRHGEQIVDAGALRQIWSGILAEVGAVDDRPRADMLRLIGEIA